MSFQQAVGRPASLIFRARRLCVPCQVRNSQIRQYAASKPRAVTNLSDKSMSPQQIRNDIDRRNRIKFLTLVRKDALLAFEPNVANELIVDFLAAEKNRVDPATNVRQLAQKYDRKVGDITYIAIPLLRIPDDKAPKRLPPSQHPTIAAHLLTACSAAEDAMATLQILSAVYHSNNDGIPQARTIARLFSRTDIKNCMAMLEKLAVAGNADALTLHGQFLERSGRRAEAKAAYEKAVETYETKIDPASPHPMALPRSRPWTALASLLMPEKTPGARAQAKAALEKGAIEADDPLAYYQLTHFEDGRTPKWLTYMNKAAASGHLEATYMLGRFYMDVHAEPAKFFENKDFRKALQFLRSWKEGSAEQLAKEWFEVAAAVGHKPSMLKLALLYAEWGDQPTATDYLQRIVVPPQAGTAEEWPKLVEDVRKMLLGQNVPIRQHA